MFSELRPGTYIVAVSGGIDSMVLLHMLHGCPGLRLIVAHFDHGIRPDSAQDRQLVAETAAAMELPFIYDEGRLGAAASEADARVARYAFLKRVKQEHDADAIITAHHQDDLLETAVLNLLRGTGRKGLTALADNPNVLRPLLGVPKAGLELYASAHGIRWREDSTNADVAYRRNYIRHTIMPRFSESQRQELLAIIAVMQPLGSAIDAEVMALLQSAEDTGHLINRSFMAGLPKAVALELLAGWLRQYGLRDFNKRTIMRLYQGIKEAEPGKYIDAQAGYGLQIGKDSIQLRMPS